MDGRVVILGMMCGALSTLAAESNTGRTNVADNTHNAIPASVSRGLNADMVTPATSKPTTSADEPYRSLCERHYYHFSNGTERTNRASMNTYNLSSCIKKPVYINGMSGLVFLENTPVSQLTECQVTVQVPSDRIVRFQVEICRRMKLEILSQVSDCPSHTDTKDCTVGGSDPRVFYSIMQAPVVKVTLPDLFYRAQLCVQFTAVTISERPGLEVVSLSSTSGYVQTPGWDGQTPYFSLMRSCVTVTAPQHAVVFVMFIVMAISRRTGAELDIFPGRCVANPDRNTLRTFVPWRAWGMRLPDALIFPDYFNVPDKTRTGPLSFRFSSKHVYMPLAGPRIRFSFHPRHSKPRVVKVENRVRWNCSEGLWPELAQHFPCDLTPQCAESEDEARCFYTTEKCGLNKTNFSLLKIVCSAKIVGLIPVTSFSLLKIVCSAKIVGLIPVTNFSLLKIVCSAKIVGLIPVTNFSLLKIVCSAKIVGLIPVTNFSLLKIVCSAKIVGLIPVTNFSLLKIVCSAKIVGLIPVTNFSLLKIVCSAKIVGLIPVTNFRFRG
ncbi:hypothetical protein ACOMHN_004657 [Nucella lapillus]